MRINHHTAVKTICIAFAAILTATTALATDLTWTGAVSSDWNNPANWIPPQIPTAADHVIINSGSVTVPASATFAIMDWSGGTIYGSLTVASNAVLNVSGSDTKYLFGPLTNSGAVIWTDTGYLHVRYNPGFGWYGAIYNLAGGLFDIQNDSLLSYPAYYSIGNELFSNTGTVRKSAGTGTTSFAIPFHNTGTVEADTGTISLQGGYSGSSSANLAISLGGAVPGSGYGKISFSTPPRFDGTFTVSTRNGYLPTPGAVFQVLNFPSSTNSFTCLSGLDLGGGILLQPQFGSTSLTLLATAYATNASQPQLFMNRTLGGLAITWPIGFPGWTLQSSTNLSSSDWASVPNACGNQAIVPVTAPKQFFRLKQ